MGSGPTAVAEACTAGVQRRGAAEWCGELRQRTSSARLVSFCAVASSYTCSPKEAVGKAWPVFSLKPGCFSYGCGGMPPAEAGSRTPPDEAAARPAAPARPPSSRRVNVGGRAGGVQQCAAVRSCASAILCEGRRWSEGVAVPGKHREERRKGGTSEVPYCLGV